MTGSDKTNTNGAAADGYRDTVFLPTTSFPMRGNLPKREPELLAHWKEMDLDGKILVASEGKPLFVLHDGPPYANGHLHIGHALNKILKDVINRSHRMSGYAVHYVPGWDCHGLPIEWKVEEEYRKAKRDKDSIPVLQFRAECRAWAAKWLDIQMSEFQRLGVQGEWSRRYSTMDYSSESAIAEEIGRFLLNGALYRGLRPVMWSPVEKTALAEAEIEYHDHTSTTIHVAFPIIKDPTPDHALAGASAVIWTTTPWTIPANRAIAFNPDITYVVLEVDDAAPEAFIAPGARLIVAADLVDQVCASCGIAAHHILHSLPGSALTGAVAAHPLRGQGYDFDVPLLPAEFVTADAGTGLVHLAPSHGEDDFSVCRANGIEVPELVADDGRYVEHTPLFAGVHVFKAADPVCDALRAVMEKSRETGSPAAGLVSRGELVHSYPHSWRSRKPVIYRATPQWFIRMDGETNIRTNALRALNDVTFVPAQARNRLTSMVADRPDWCISRQRAWGVPIAVFVNRRTGEVLRDAVVMERIVAAFRTEGADAWYDSEPSRFLGNEYDAAEYEQVFDVVDVWFESGSTHAFVLGQPGLRFPADLYLEGSDQHRGWFQSSLLESVGTRGVAPYRTLVTNGFVLDEQGRKMSKSLGNVIAPQDVNDTLGSDILRLWVMNSDTNDDLRIGKDILKQQGELYRRLRNTLRWLLGALEGFSEEEALPYEQLPELEQWVLHRLTDFNSMIRKAVDTHEWVGVYPALHGFCTTDLSAFYFDVRKDTIYCDAPDSVRRRAARTVLDVLHRCLTTWLAPVLVFTADDAWTARFGQDTSVHLEAFPELPEQWRNPELDARWATLRAVRRIVTTEIETARRSGLIGSSLQASVELPVYEDQVDALAGIDWAELAIVSQAEISVIADKAPRDEHGNIVMPCGVPVVIVADGAKCERCWKVLPEVGQDSAHPTLCVRCADVVSHAHSCSSVGG
ncbi:isoleucyl-tRNA synthetase [Acetobacter estunensis NRIC 0472]|uniref:Isoleucine--tRNA ligase n=1 Tax=Acetobacter estunensis TaxID=104097 RepID=A0A967EGP6_9PROT|nr:isoleucine--tRNA ligase [Acetobacter estunensis]NHO52717.1 isoleucine--tRNA ligase [Acetobacter estunensis]GBQ23110.1 isoleucyl-tRNA synthetase [Acetobacter estunensis NRIC 0472]